MPLLVNEEHGPVERVGAGVGGRVGLADVEAQREIAERPVGGLGPAAAREEREERRLVAARVPRPVREPPLRRVRRDVGLDPRVDERARPGAARDLCGIPTDSRYLRLKCSETILQSSRIRGARTDGPRIVGNEFDLTAMEDFEDFLGYPKTSGGIPHGAERRSRRPGRPRSRGASISWRQRRGIRARQPRRSRPWRPAPTRTAPPRRRLRGIRPPVRGPPRILQNALSIAAKLTSFSTIIGPFGLCSSSSRRLERKGPWKFVRKHSS